MTAWKILLTDGLEENGKAILGAAAEVVDQTGVSAEDLLKIVGEYDALIVRGRTKVTAAVFDAAANLKVVGRAGVGVDNIDLDAATDLGIQVVNTPHAVTEGVDAAQSHMAALAAAGISLDEITTELLAQGVASFSASYDKLLSVIGEKKAALAQ